MKAFGAKFSDLSGPTNPSGILSPAFLALKQALDRGDEPDNVLQALYDWLSQRKITPVQVDKILDLPSMEAAYDALIGLVGGSLSPKALPPAVQQTVQRAIQRLAQKYVERGEQELDQARQRFTSIRGRYGVESARQIVRRLLSS
jgi:hypothetical protein